jgi:hypothetical protein
MDHMPNHKASRAKIGKVLMEIQGTIPKRMLGGRHKNKN